MRAIWLGPITALTFLGLSPLAVLPAQAQTHHAASKAAPKSISNSDVIALASAGLSDNVIIAKIHAASATDFDTSVAGLSALKTAGVSSTVISYMVDPSAPIVPPAAAGSAAPPAKVTPVDSPDDPASVHSPGIYILATGNDGKEHLTKLDHISAKQTKTSGAFLSGMTYGITKAHVKVSIEGDRATVHTHDTDPAFYAYIPEDQNTFGGSSLTIRDFSLIKLDSKSSSREVNTATISPWGASSGTDQKSLQGFSPETIKPGVYKLTLDKPLPVGQYAFQYHNYGEFYDFGITPAE
jgi:hypothetical protein